MQFVNGWLVEAKEYNLMGNSWNRGGVPATHLVVHGTAGGSDGSSVAAYMGSVGVSTHFIISTDGTIWQLVDANAAAWGNAPLDGPRFNFARADLNPNLWTISIEFCKPDTTNQINITDAQKASGFPLIKTICDTYNIHKAKGDGTGGIISHADINSVNRSGCPGTYPWDELIAYLNPVTTSGIPHTTGGHPRMTPNANMLKAAQAEWNSTASLFKDGTPRYDTGIAKDWQECLWRGLHIGAPLTQEYASVDWDGKPITCQQFQYARAEHVFGGSTRWFGAYGEIQVPK